MQMSNSMSFPVTAQLDDSTRVEVHLHRFYLGDRERNCWTYLTDGFAALGQREMAVSLLVEDDENPDEFPKTPVRLFRLLSERFDGSRPVDFGDASRLGQRGIFGFTAAYYVPAIQFEGLPPLDNHLALVLVHDEEYEYAQQYGLTRFLSRLGRFCSSFPYPTWNTAARPSLFARGAREVSILSTAHHVMAEHSYVQREHPLIRFHLHARNAAPVMAALEAITTDQVAVISTAFAPGCDASLYWQEGQTSPGAFAAPDSPGRTLGGSFIALSRDERSELDIEEDGFVITLNSEHWRQLTHSLNRQEASQFDLADGNRLEVVLINEAPEVSARHYEPVAVWQRIDTSEEDSPGSEKVLFQAPVDTSAGQNLAERVSRNELMDYLELVRRLLEKAMENENDHVEFALELQINPGSISARVATSESLNPDFIQFIENAVVQVRPCTVTSGISVKIPVSVNQDPDTKEQ
jgi:hypothetical protein